MAVVLVVAKEETASWGRGEVVGASFGTFSSAFRRISVARCMYECVYEFEHRGVYGMMRLCVQGDPI